VSILVRSYTGIAHYEEGVGSRWYSSLFGGVTGLGGGLRLDDMYSKLVQTYKGGDRNIDIIGFSRGSALAREFANQIFSQGIVETTNSVLAIVRRVYTFGPEGQAVAFAA